MEASQAFWEPHPKTRFGIDSAEENHLTPSPSPALGRGEPMSASCALLGEDRAGVTVLQSL